MNVTPKNTSALGNASGVVLSLQPVQSPVGVTVNEEQKLFVIPSKGGFSCLGFQVCEDRAIALASELAALGYSIPMPQYFGTVERYAQLAAMQETARVHFERTGYRFHCQLTKELIGLEGKRVEAVDPFGERVRFWVGRSTGWIPCHLQIARRNCHGGQAVLGPLTKIRVVAIGPK